MKTDNNFVRSGRERVADDNYQTIDPRCVPSLIGSMKFDPDLGHNFVDCCAPSGSGIVDSFLGRGFQAHGIADAYQDYIGCDWVVSNPPYKRNVVDNIIYRQVQRLVDGDVHLGVAMLLRTQFDHAKTRHNMFGGNPLYAGQVKMTFRPIWFEEGESTPIHNYVWHIWARGWNKPPQIWYW